MKAKPKIDIKAQTNTIESIHASFRKVTKKGAFPNEKSLLKLLYLRISELDSKWAVGHIRNWALILNQLMMNDSYSKKIEKYSAYL
ncbi:transposase [Lactococcus sp. DD01]|uniref:transposase n=1 Tax=Lactococcus sp. DD01 TaxID=1776443 RepID=UPI0012E719BF